jgi:hypothetical protein
MAKKDDEFDQVEKLLLKVIEGNKVAGEPEIIDKKAYSPKCWNLDVDLNGVDTPTIASWPMDVESLVLHESFKISNGGKNPLGEILDKATDEDKWDSEEACADCSSKDFCPFYTNARKINREDQKTKHNLLNLFIGYEMKAGQKINFRMAFSLIAKLLVGEKKKYSGYSHPCEWVHEKADKFKNAKSKVRKIGPLYELLQGLFYNILFPYIPVEDPNNTELEGGEELVEEIYDTVISRMNQFLDKERTSPIENLILGQDFSDLDPVFYRDEETLISVEDQFGESIEQGNSWWKKEFKNINPAEIEEKFFRIIAQAQEDELDKLAMESRQTSVANDFLVKTSVALAKRSIGVQKGFFNESDYINKYLDALESQEEIHDLTNTFCELFTRDNRFHFDHLSTLGQPSEDVDSSANSVSLLAGGIGNYVRAFPVGLPSENNRPLQYLPYIRLEFQNQTGQEDNPIWIPLTYELFKTISMKSNGSRNGSLPVEPRISLGRIEHLIAGNLCRSSHHNVELKIGNAGKITPLGGIEINGSRN